MIFKLFMGERDNIACPFCSRDCIKWIMHNSLNGHYHCLDCDKRFKVLVEK